MRFLHKALFGLAICAIAVRPVQAQRGDPSSGGTYVYIGYSGVGNLTEPGMLNRESPLVNFGRVGGLTTNSEISNIQAGEGFGRVGPDRRAATPSARAAEIASTAGLGLNAPRGGIGPQSSGRNSTSFSLPGYGGGYAGAGETDRYDKMRSELGLREPRYGRGGKGITLGSGSRGGFGLPSPRRAPGRYPRGRGIGPDQMRGVTERGLLLSPRSHLGKVASGAPSIPLPEAVRAAAEPLPTITPPPPTTVMERDIRESATERFGAEKEHSSESFIQLGDELMIGRNYAEARSYYGLAHEIQPDSPQPMLRMLLSSLFLQDAYQAWTYLTLAIRRAKSLDDLRVDIETCMPSRELFQSYVRSTGDQVSTSEFAPSAAMYAYLSWLAGDAATARRAADQAMQISNGKSPEVDKLQALLKSAPTPIQR